MLHSFDNNYELLCYIMNTIKNWKTELLEGGGGLIKNLNLQAGWGLIREGSLLEREGGGSLELFTVF